MRKEELAEGFFGEADLRTDSESGGRCGPRSLGLPKGDHPRKPRKGPCAGIVERGRGRRTIHLKNCGQRVVEVVEGSSINFTASMILRSSPIRGVFGNSGGAFYFTFLRLKSLVPLPKDGGTAASFGYASL